MPEPEEQTLLPNSAAAKGRRQKGLGKKVTQKREKGYQKVTENEKKVTKKQTKKIVSGLPPFAAC